MNWVDLLLIALSLAPLGLHVWAFLICRNLFRPVKPETLVGRALPAVSIIKPLKGTDPSLYQNLESFCNLDYPDYELLFCISDPGDSAKKLVGELILKYPQVNARLVIAQENVGPNPKVNNMVSAYEQANCDHILVSDSNVNVHSDDLKKMMTHFLSGVGMVTSLVMGIESEGISSQLEAMILNTFYARGMLLAYSLGKPCVVGKSMLFKRTEMNRIGGIKTLGRYLAEDFMAGEAMQQLGHQVVIASNPVRQVIGKIKFKDHWLRHLRWGRIRKSQAPFVFLLEPIFIPVTGAIALSTYLNIVFGIPFVTNLITYLFICSLFDLGIIYSVQSATIVPRLVTPIEYLRNFLVWILREAMHPFLWLHIGISNSVMWRGQKLSLLPGGLLELPIAPAAKEK